MNRYLSTIVIALVLCCVVGTNALAKDAGSQYVNVPVTISEQAQAVLQMKTDPNLRPELPDADDLGAWKVVQDEAEHRMIELCRQKIEELHLSLKETSLGGVPVLDVRPKDWKDSGKVVVYVHGGAYTFFSAHSTLLTAALVADVTGLRVLSVDYTLAPRGKWQQVTEQVVSVFKALHEQGYDMKDVAMFGDSAGGGLAAGSVLKMRDSGMKMPAAVVLWSPWADITDVGDTYSTLKHADPAYLYDKHLKKSADAYADPKDQKHPYVSPVYGNYSKGFPPTLIQGGTKEIFLSNFVRLYQAIDTAGQTAKLDIYEGMIHVFQAALVGTPESEIALGKVNAFLEQYLGK